MSYDPNAPLRTKPLLETTYTTNGSTNPTTADNSSTSSTPWQSWANVGLGAYAAWNAQQQLNLAQDAFKAQKATAKADYAARAKGYNEELGRRSDVGLALAGSGATPSVVAKEQARVNSAKVDPTLKI